MSLHQRHPGDGSSNVSWLYGRQRTFPDMFFNEGHRQFFRNGHLVFIWRWLVVLHIRHQPVRGSARLPTARNTRIASATISRAPPAASNPGGTTRRVHARGPGGITPFIHHRPKSCLTSSAISIGEIKLKDLDASCCLLAVAIRTNQGSWRINTWDRLAVGKWFRNRGSSTADTYK